MSIIVTIRGYLLRLLICLLAFNQLGMGQDRFTPEKKLSRKAATLVQNKRLKAALPMYQELHKLYAENPEYNYYLGFIHLNIATDKSVALPFLEAAYEHKKDWPRVVRYLARAHHLLYHFDEAKTFYEEYMSRLSDEERIADVKHEIQKCTRGKILVKDTLKADISNLGSLINTAHPDYAPIISSDDQMLIFTSRRPATTGGRKDYDQLYFEDIYISLKEKGVWQAPKNAGTNVNTELHDASIGLSADAQQMFVYHGENIYTTSLKGDEWSVPKKVGSNINSKSWETHACISLDQQVLYFTSDREGGYGGMDIYMAVKLPNGNWGLVQNLGPTVNTPYDDKAPFIHPADKTLYFSSKGHYNMGGFDIFRSSFIDNQWSTPKNLGYPINTPGDDIFYVVSANGQHTYLSSDLRKDNMGGQDIYQLTLPDTGRVKIAIIRGRIYGKEQKPLSASFTVLDNETNKVVGVYNSNASTGKYLLVFPTGKAYNMIIRAEGYIPHKENFTIPEQDYIYNLSQEIGLTHLRKNDSIVGQKVIFRNSFYDIETAITSDISLNTQESEEATFSQFLRNLENPKKRAVVLERLLSLGGNTESNIYRGIFDYSPRSQIHLFQGKETANLEPTLIEFEKDTVVLNRDTIFKEETVYVTSSSSHTKVDLTSLDTTIDVFLEVFEKELEVSDKEESASAFAIKPNPVIPDNPEIEAPSPANPDPEPEPMTKGTQRIFFGFGESSMQPDSSSTLDNLIANMKTDKTLRAAINGYTDHLGSTAYNKKLSLERANAVANMIKARGISMTRLDVNGYGESNPIAPNTNRDGTDNPLGRMQNRRTEIRLVEVNQHEQSKPFKEERKLAESKQTTTTYSRRSP